MKKVMILFALAAFTTSFAQVNKNQKEETVEIRTVTQDNQGTDVQSKSVTKSTHQKIELNNDESHQINQSVVMSPKKVDTDVSYSYDGNRFKFINQVDKEGYRLMTVKDNATQKEYAIIKPTSQNGYYIYSKDGTSSFGYFNEDGNFVVESYDPKADAVVSQIYKLQLKSGNK